MGGAAGELAGLAEAPVLAGRGLGRRPGRPCRAGARAAARRRPGGGRPSKKKKGGRVTPPKGR